jgi:hypothetical protein
VKSCATVSLMFLLFTFIACGGKTSSPSTATSGPLAGNWQMVLLQEFPGTKASFSVSGFIDETNDTLTGSVQAPPLGAQDRCGGVSPLTGTVSGQNVTFTVNEFGTTVNFNGTISSDNQSMSGDFQGLGGACLNKPTTGTWNAFLIPPLTGNFTGTINSTYMELLQGGQTPVPVAASGSFTQSSNAGASNATISGTITAVGYPCFATVSVTGTISGQNVYLQIYNYIGEQIGRIGTPSSSSNGGGASPATVVLGPTGFSLLDTSPDGLFLGINTPGPCPPIVGGTLLPGTDNGSIAFNFQ